MMHTVDETDVAAPPATVFRFAADVERWPDILPHYRWVTMGERTREQAVVEMMGQLAHDDHVHTPGTERKVTSAAEHHRQPLPGGQPGGGGVQFKPDRPDIPAVPLAPPPGHGGDVTHAGADVEQDDGARRAVGQDPGQAVADCSQPPEPVVGPGDVPERAGHDRGIRARVVQQFGSG